MFRRSSIRESIQDSGDIGRKKPHSHKVYHRFFEGYMTQPVFSQNGKKKRIEYIYVADYYRQDMPKQKRRGVKCLYALLYFVACMSFIRATTQAVGSNSVWLVNFIQAIAVFALGWMFIALVYYIMAPEQMTIYIYKTIIHFHFFFSRRIAAGALVALICVNLLYLVWKPSERKAAGMLILLFYVLCAACILGISWIEKRISYTIVENREGKRLMETKGEGGRSC